MSTIGSQITGVSIMCSPVCSSAGDKKHRTPTPLALFPHKRQVTRKMFSFDDVIMHGSVLICIFSVSTDAEKIANPHTLDHKSDHVTNLRTNLRRILNLKKKSQICRSSLSSPAEAEGKDQRWWLFSQFMACWYFPCSFYTYTKSHCLLNITFISYMRHRSLSGGHICQTWIWFNRSNRCLKSQ